MNVLVDTSVWSLVLRRGTEKTAPEARQLHELIAGRRVQMIGPIRQELLSGIRGQSQFKTLEARLSAFPDLPILTDDYIAAAHFFNTCRAEGIQGSNTDFLICAVAARNRLSIYTTDKDFTRFADHVPIAFH